MHELSELYLRRWHQAMPDSMFQPALQTLRQNKFYTAETEEVVQVYVGYAAEKISEAYGRCKDPEIQIEMRSDYSRWAPEGFGTADLVTVSDGLLEIIDFKGGKRPVSAQGNSQMRLYALGVLDAFDYLYDIDTVRMTIVQPRKDSIDSEEISVADLLEWGDTVVRPIAALAAEGKGELSAGDHCEWCRAQGPCRAKAERNLEIQRYNFSDPHLLDDDEIADILARSDELQSWVSCVKKFALQQALQGAEYHGWKVVAGKSNRRYSDPDVVSASLIEAGYEPSIIFKPQELLGITDMQTVLSKEKFDDLLKGLLIKPPGKPALVPESDKRPVLGTTVDFDDDEDDDEE